MIIGGNSLYYQSIIIILSNSLYKNHEPKLILNSIINFWPATPTKQSSSRLLANLYIAARRHPGPIYCWYHETFFNYSLVVPSATAQPARLQEPSTRYLVTLKHRPNTAFLRFCWVRLTLTVDSLSHRCLWK